MLIWVYAKWISKIVISALKTLFSPILPSCSKDHVCLPSESFDILKMNSFTPLNFIQSLEQ